MEDKNFVGEKELKQYKDFAFKTDKIKMSVAFILGSSFNKVVTGVSELILMPIVNFVAYQAGGSWRKWHVEPLKGLNFEVGEFLGIMLEFFLISLILYIVYKRFNCNEPNNICQVPKKDR